MIMDFVYFELAKKLKEKGFICQHPIAMYNEIGDFCILTTSADYMTSPSGYKCRCYYDYDDFDEHDFIAPTIAQVLKWLREEKKIEVVASFSYRNRVWGYQVGDMTLSEDSILAYDYSFPTYEKATIVGIEYVLNNLI